MSAVIHWLMLDRSYDIVAASTLSGLPERHVGDTLWAIFPEAEELYRDLYETAWTEGFAENDCFHLGRLMHVTAERTAIGLLVSYRVLAEIDTVTLPALRSSLDRLVLIADAQDQPPSPALPGDLRLVDAP
jgi:hypothetical protein